MPIGALAGVLGGIVTGASAAAPAAVSIYTARQQSKAAQNATNAQITSANRAADLEAKAAADALDFQKQQEAERKAEFEKTQALNLDQYNQQLARMAHYRNIGLAALANLGQLPGASANTPLVPGRMTLGQLGGR